MSKLDMTKDTESFPLRAKRVAYDDPVALSHEWRQFRSKRIEEYNLDDEINLRKTSHTYFVYGQIYEDSEGLEWSEFWLRDITESPDFCGTEDD